VRERRDSGETLVEILITVVITGLTVTALVSSLGVAGNAGNVHRSSVESDVVMRNYAEATKAAVRGCVAGAPYTVVYVPPAGFTVATQPTAHVCPNLDATQLVAITVDGPLGVHQTMDIKVRTP